MTTLSSKGSRKAPAPVEIIGGLDAAGEPLPAGFENMAGGYGRTASGAIEFETRTDGVNTWTKAYVLDGQDRITAWSAWTKS